MTTTNILQTIPARHPAAQAPERNPAAVYLASLSTGSRRAMNQAMGVVAEMLTGSPADPLTLPWWAVTYAHTQAVRSRLAERYAPAAGNKILSALRGVLKESWRLGYLDAETYHRAVDVKTIKGTSAPKGRAVDVGEITALVRACAEDGRPAGVRDTALLAVLYAGGLRRSEAVSLDGDDYSTDTGALTIRHAKGNKGRIVYLRNGAKAALDTWTATRGNASGPLFPRMVKGGRITDGRMTDQAVMVILNRRAEQAHVKPFSPHDLRRSFAGELLDGGVDLVTVQRLMGHASPNTTARYDRRDDRAKQAAAARIAFPVACTTAPARA